MGTYNSAVITTAGQSLLARAIADSLPFYFTSAKTTEYVVPSGTSAASLTELPNIKQSEDITSATVAGGNQVTTSVRFDNAEITLAYSINTIGVYAKAGTDTEETLLAVITAITADVIPSYSAANPVSYVYSINLAISNASNINIVVSPTGTVNVAEFTELKERVDAIIDSGSGLSTDAKIALMNCFEHVAWTDEHGQTYYDTLHDALFPTAVSISATFTPGGHVFYETDSLDALRPYLIVRATMPDSSVEIVTDYVLTGSMAVGTNTITVRYQGHTDTFEVTTQANPAYIEAVFTQPQTTIYTDDSLDSLKDYLVVTYYYAPGATGTVLADSAYTLSGTLTEGTSVITVSYQGLTDTFNVTVTADALTSISAVFTQNGNVFTSTDLLDDLKPFLAVTAHYLSGDTETVSNYTLSGDLNSATSTVTVTYEGETTTFTVSVTMLPTGYTAKSYVQTDGTQYIATSIPETYMESKWSRYKAQITQLLDKAGHVFSSTNYYTPYCRYFPTQNARKFSYQRYGNQNPSYTDNSIQFELDTDVVFENFRNSNNVIFNGNLAFTVESGDTKSAKNMFSFFCAGSLTSQTFRLRGKLFWFKIYNGNVKTNDFVPCVNSSNVVGLYDLVTGTFYPPSEGTLTAD